ncbi:MAG: anti-sigma factor domain-containing protein [Burkholderiales bacterium]
MNYLQPERLDALAREFVLGTLTGAARRRFLKLLQQSPAARVAVSVWQERWMTLEAEAPQVTPSPQVWAALERRIHAGAIAAPARTEAGGSKLGAWLQNLFSPRSLGGALVGVLLCVVLLRMQPIWLGVEPLSDGLPASYVGLLTDNQGRPTVLASSRRQGQQLTVKLLQPMAVPAGQVAQLWALPQDGSAAFPVAVVPSSGSAKLVLSQSSEKLFFNVSRLAVSFEAAPAKAGDKPSSDFVLSGHCVKLW